MFIFLFLYAEASVVPCIDTQCPDHLPEENCSQGILASLEAKKM